MLARKFWRTRKFQFLGVMFVAVVVLLRPANDFFYPEATFVNMGNNGDTQYLEQPDGVLAYDDSGGTGDLILMTSGLGDIRFEYRLLTPILIEAGYRVVTMDLRGHGQSSVGWSTYGIDAIGQDMLALIKHLGDEPATLISNSYSAAAAVWAATEAPDQIRNLVLIGPALEDSKQDAVETALVKFLAFGPWRVRAWDLFYASLYPVRQPDDFATYREQLRANLAQPGRFDAVEAMMWETRDPISTRMDQVTQPVLIIIGSDDPDSDNPTDEAARLSELLNAQRYIVQDGGHYPHADTPDETGEVILDFVLSSNAIE